MKITLIGAGNVATHLAVALQSAGHNILQVFSRTETSAAALAAQIGAQPVTDVAAVLPADIYILAIKDRAIGNVVADLCRGRENKLFVHTSGSVDMGVFQGHCCHYGVFYPMQTFSKSRPVDFRRIPCFVEGSDAATLQFISQLASSVSDQVVAINSEQRRHLHLAAVWACNFANHCYDVASVLLEKSGLSFDAMLPLIDETAAKVHVISPAEAQTGPAVRFDTNVMDAHLSMLESEPLLRDLYQGLSQSIHRRAEGLACQESETT